MINFVNNNVTDSLPKTKRELNKTQLIVTRKSSLESAHSLATQDLLPQLKKVYEIISIIEKLPIREIAKIGKYDAWVKWAAERTQNYAWLTYFGYQIAKKTQKYLKLYGEVPASHPHYQILIEVNVVRKYLWNCYFLNKNSANGIGSYKVLANGLIIKQKTKRAPFPRTFKQGTFDKCSWFGTHTDNAWSKIYASILIKRQRTNFGFSSQVSIPHHIYYQIKTQYDKSLTPYATGTQAINIINFDGAIRPLS
tara:strand:+ start:122 stop:877 length:756 start_codon:yes stop_codon:yes gene_type:complete